MSSAGATGLVTMAVVAAACGSADGDAQPPPPPSGASRAPTPPAVDLRPFAGRHRVLIVFVPGEGDALRAHRRLWADAGPGTEERDLVRLEVVGAEVRREGKTLGAAGTLRSRFAPEAPGTVVLVGKDGGEKLRGTGLTPAEVFAAIDVMPMRRQEMKRRHSRGSAPG
ncbi:MAG: DUF4174 domain-containing protein [Myxococcota bacterium]